MTASDASPRVLVMRAGQLGDTVFATSLLEPLHRELGGKLRVDLVVKQGMGVLFAQDPRVGRVFELTHRRLPLPLSRDKRRVLAAGRRQSYDLLINLEMDSFLDDLARRVPAERKLGSPFASVADDRDGEHAVDHLLRLGALFLSEASLNGAAPSLVAPPTRSLIQKLGLPTEYIVLNPTNSHFRKQDKRSYRAWPFKHWRQLLREQAATNRASVLIGGAGERDYFRELEPLPAGVINLAGRTRLDELLALIAGARALVSTDTGPAHLAAALGTPVLAIFGPSDSRKTGPYAGAGARVRILSAGLPCGPCTLNGGIDNCSFNRCMHEVEARHVLEALTAILNEATNTQGGEV